MARRDDDALSWDGDDDPTLDVGTDAAPGRQAETSAPVEPAPIETVHSAAALPAGYSAVGKGADEVGRIESDGTVIAPGGPAPMGNTTLVSLGVLGGVYLLLTVGWLLGGAKLNLIAQLFLDPIAFQITLWLAVLAPPIWFVTVLLLTRGRRAWIRFALLAVGAIVLVPWPFVLSGAAL